MYRLTPSKMRGIAVSKPIVARGATTVFFQANKRYLSGLTVEEAKTAYLYDMGVTKTPPQESVGNSYWLGYDYKGAFLSLKLPVYPLLKIPILQKISRSDYRKLDKMWWEVFRRWNWKINRWEQLAGCKYKVLAKPALWIMEHGLENKVKHDFGLRNFLYHQGKVLWYDPFVSNEVLKAVWLTKTPS